MATWNTFEDINAWKSARSFHIQCQDILTRLKEKHEYGLHQQISRSAGSIMDNIAEGLGRGGNKEFRQFLYYSRGSAFEVHSQLIRCLDIGIINQDEYNQLLKELHLTRKLIGGLIKYLSKTELSGHKYKG